MRGAIEHRQIATENYIRPHCSAVAHGINRRLAFDYQQYLQQSFSLACSDLKICYDIIFHLASSLALFYLAIPLLSINIMLNTIQRMSHTVRTSYRDSNLTYGGDTITHKFRHFMMGLCEGNGCAHQLWSIMSYIVF